MHNNALPLLTKGRWTKDGTKFSHNYNNSRRVSLLIEFHIHGRLELWVFCQSLWGLVRHQIWTRNTFNAMLLGKRQSTITTEHHVIRLTQADRQRKITAWPHSVSAEKSRVWDFHHRAMEHHLPFEQWQFWPRAMGDVTLAAPDLDSAPRFNVYTWPMRSFISDTKISKDHPHLVQLESG